MFENILLRQIHPIMLSTDPTYSLIWIQKKHFAIQLYHRLVNIISSFLERNEYAPEPSSIKLGLTIRSEKLKGMRMPLIIYSFL